MSEQIWLALIALIPSLCWLGLAVFILLYFGQPITSVLIPKISRVKIFGVEASFVKQAISDAAKRLPVGGERSVNSVARRAEQLSDIVRGAKILLVNDVPQQMDVVISILRSLKITVTIATSSNEALGLLKRRKFDIVISDVERSGVSDEGINFLRKAVAEGINRPTIFTVANFDPSRGTPPYAFGITNRVDELLQMVFDLLERLRG